MKNPKRNARQFRQSMFSLAAIIGAFAVAGSIASPADAGVVTADSKAWTNSGLTGEVGVDYRSFEQTKTRTETRTREVKVVVPATAATYDEHGVELTAATPEYTAIRHQIYHVTVPFTQRNSGLQGTGKVSGRISSDVLLSVGYGGSLYGSTSVKNGKLVGTLGTTLFGTNRPQLFGTVAYGVAPNLSAIADFRQGQSSYGAQYQMGNSHLYGAYSPATKGYSFGYGLEVGSR